MSVSNDGKSRKKSNKRKQYSVRLGGILYRERFSTAELGRQWQRKMRLEWEAGSHGLKVQREQLSIDDIVEKFLAAREHLASRGIDRRNIQKYILPHFRNRRLNEITKHEWMRLLGDGALNKDGLLVTQYGLSRATVRLIRSIANTLYEFARKRLDLPVTNVIRDVKPLKVPEKKFRCLHTETDVQKFLEAARNESPMYFAFVMLSLNTGLRAGNVVTLKWSDVNFERGSILVRRKLDHETMTIVDGLKAHDGLEHEIGMSDSLRSFLVAWRSQTTHSAPDDFVCAVQGDGKMLPWPTLQKTHRRAMAASGVDYVNIHGLRHTYATMYLERGGSVYDLKHILNHSSITVTEAYTHNTRKRLKETSSVVSFDLHEPDSNVAQFKVRKKI